MQTYKIDTDMMGSEWTEADDFDDFIAALNAELEERGIAVRAVSAYSDRAGFHAHAEQHDAGGMVSEAIWCAAIDRYTRERDADPCDHEHADDDKTGAYTYTIFDGHPGEGGSCAWPDHEDIEVEADFDAEAVDAVRDALALAAYACAPEAGYEVGTAIYAMVTDEDEQIVDILTHELTAEELGVVEPCDHAQLDHDGACKECGETCCEHDADNSAEHGWCVCSGCPLHGDGSDAE